MFNIPDNATDQEIVNSFIRISMCYNLALQVAQHEPFLIRDTIDKRLSSLKRKEIEVGEKANAGMKNSLEVDLEIYNALEILNSNSGHNGCRSAVQILNNYLNNRPDSIMGRALFEAISEQFEG